MTRHASGEDRNRRRPGYTPEEFLHMAALGRAVARLREEQTGLSRFQFALEADVHRNSMNALENGESSAGFLVLRRVADTLGIPMSELMRAYEAELAQVSRET